MVASFKALYQASEACRKGKRKGAQCQRYEANLISHLFDAHWALHSKTWQASPMRRFIVINGGKPREVHAAAYADRVVQHYLVARLAKMIAPKFIFDSAANQQGKGTHFAVRRLQKMMRQAAAQLPASQQIDKQVYYLQLDIHNFFYSIDKPILLAILVRHYRMAIKRRQISLQQARDDYWLCLQILKRGESYAVRSAEQDKLARQMLPYKTLGGTAADKGLPIGHLTSQFFGNMVLNELDQFIKHQLKARHYVRYVDDFILVHPHRAQLTSWQAEIEAFLASKLKLKLKPQVICKPISQGADFLGYIVRAHYLLTRRRVLGNFYHKLTQWQQQWIAAETQGKAFNLNLEATAALNSMLASYSGHLQHAQHHRALLEKQRQFPWLALFYEYDGRRWQSKLVNKAAQRFIDQWQFFRQHYQAACLIMQKGSRWVIDAQPKPWLQSPAYALDWPPAPHRLWEITDNSKTKLIAALRTAQQPIAIITEQGYAHARLKARQLAFFYQPLTTLSMHD